MRLLTSAILLAAITTASASQSHIKRQAIQPHWESSQTNPSQLTQNLNFHVNSKPISLGSIFEPATQNSDISQITADQILKQLQQSTNIYNIPSLQPHLLQPTSSQTQLNYNRNPLNPATFYITNPNHNQVLAEAKAQELTSSAEVRPVQHSSVINHGSYNPFESLSDKSAPLRTVQHKRPQGQAYAPIKLAQPYALPQPQHQAQFVPQKRPQYQVQQQHLVAPNVYNFAPQAQKPTPNRYNFQAQPQKPAQYNPLSAVLNPYQPQKTLPTPSSTPAPFHARPQSFQTAVQNQKPNTTPSRNSHREDVKKVNEEEENEDTRDIDDRDDDDENVSKEEYNYRDEGSDDDDTIDEADSREYHPTFQAARYIFDRDISSEEDEDSSSSNIYPKPSKYYKYDENPFGKHYGDEHNKYLARYKKSRYYKPKKNKESTYELEGKSSQNIPIAIQNHELVEEKWFLTKKQ